MTVTDYDAELGFTCGGRDEYAAATEKIFSRVIELGTQFKSLPDYDPKNDRINKKKRK